MHTGCELKDGSVSNFGQFLVKNIQGNQRKTMQMKNEWDTFTDFLKKLMTGVKLGSPLGLRIKIG